MGENPTRPALNKELSYLQERALSPAATPPPAGACCIREPVCLHPHWTERGLLRLPTEVLCSRTQPLESLRRAHEIRAPSKHPASQPAQRQRRPGRARHAHTPLYAAAVRSQDPGPARGKAAQATAARTGAVALALPLGSCGPPSMSLTSQCLSFPFHNVGPFQSPALRAVVGIQ